MKNVYESVRFFFEEELVEPSIISREWVEGFLRQKAWSGSADKDLHELWKQLKSFQVYLAYTHYRMLDELAAADYAEVIRWLVANSTGFKPTVKTVRRFFDALLEFYQYLIGRKLIANCQELQIAREQIAGGKRLDLGLGHNMEDLVPDSLTPENSPLHSEELFPGIIQKLMPKIGSYFQSEDFDDDFHRALYLYVGPLQAVPTSEEDGFSDFWIGFWDYFLFDYHLRRDDLTPVAHYLQAKRRISAGERELLQDLSVARFTVFYIQRIVDAQWVECVNLFTGEMFQMPYPEFDYKMMKRLLFFGHVFSHGAFVANYMASIEVSSNLRQRVKQEVLRLKALFDIQEPGSTWEEFLTRHCLAVRHTITLLTTFAKLNVTSVDALSPLPAKPETVRQPDSRVIEQLRQLMPKYGFSSHDIRLAEAMWHDFSQVAEIHVRKSGSWAAAIISCYAELNTPFTLAVEELAQATEVSPASIYANRRRIAESLAVQRHDPRFLSEEGFLLLLYSS